MCIRDSYKFEPKSGAISLYRASAAPFNPANYVSEQRFYQSKDGTRVPLIISYRKGLKHDGSNPTILYGLSLIHIYPGRVAHRQGVRRDVPGHHGASPYDGARPYGDAWADDGLSLIHI